MRQCLNNRCLAILFAMALLMVGCDNKPEDSNATASSDSNAKADEILFAASLEHKIDSKEPEKTQVQVHEVKFVTENQ